MQLKLIEYLEQIGYEVRESSMHDQAWELEKLALKRDGLPDEIINEAEKLGLEIKRPRTNQYRSAEEYSPVMEDQAEKLRQLMRNREKLNYKWGTDYAEAEYEIIGEEIISAAAAKIIDSYDLANPADALRSIFEATFGKNTASAYYCKVSYNRDGRAGVFFTDQFNPERIVELPPWHYSAALMINLLRVREGNFNIGFYRDASNDIQVEVIPATRLNQPAG